MIIDIYTDEQAIEDGYLIPFPHHKGWCCTRAVWEELPEEDGEGKIRHLGALVLDASFEVQRVLKINPDEWLISSGPYVEESGYWLARNGLGGFTIMKPEDY